MKFNISAGFGAVYGILLEPGWSVAPEIPRKGRYDDGIGKAL
jgi:hypothetical protein